MDRVVSESHVNVADPREEYDDLIVERGDEHLDAEAFAAARGMEAYQSGWVAVGVVVDESDRILLAYHQDDEQWLAPGGTLQAGESLREGLVREIHEEAGIEISPVRPHAVGEWAVHHGDEQIGFRVVTFEARAETTEVGDVLGDEDEPISEARWFDELPEDVFHRERTERVLARVRSKERR